MGVVMMVVLVVIGWSVFEGMKVVVEKLSECGLGLVDWCVELKWKVKLWWGDVRLMWKGGDGEYEELVRMRSGCGGNIVVMEVKKGWKWVEIGYVYKKEEENIGVVIGRMESGEEEKEEVYREEKCEECGNEEWSVEFMGDLLCKECEMEKVRLDEEKVGGWDVCDWCGEKKVECDCVWEGKGE